MAGAHIPTGGTVPKLGRVNEICQEWMIREDGAMAYHLQDQEIRQHYSGNKQRNALVREDFPTAKNEQQKETELAEQAAAVYRRMLEEQEELDKMLAERLTKKLEIEEKMCKNVEDRESFSAAKKVQEEIPKPPVLRQFKPNKEFYQQSKTCSIDGVIDLLPPIRELKPPIDLPCPERKPSTFGELHLNMGSAHKTQEEADAELARILQEQEGNPEECILQRDRLLAIEAQDKELAKVLQERERIKAKKAKEKARQKALARKLQKKQEEIAAHDVIMPDDAYSNPADMVLPQNRNLNLHQPARGSLRGYEEHEDNYSLPVNGLELTQSISECGLPEYPNYTSNKEDSPARPSHLSIRPAYKPRFPDPEELSNKQHPNIAMVIDPTYTKQELPHSPSLIQHLSPARSVSSKSSTKSSPSTSSSKDIDVKLEMSNSPAPPYMPIQGQKRTASLEKRRMRDGCKQQ